MSAGKHGTFITETRGVGFIARCICGWEDQSAGYDYGLALRTEGEHPGPGLDRQAVIAHYMPVTQPRIDEAAS